MNMSARHWYNSCTAPPEGGKQAGEFRFWEYGRSPYSSDNLNTYNKDGLFALVLIPRVVFKAITRAKVAAAKVEPKKQGCTLSLD